MMRKSIDTGPHASACSRILPHRCSAFYTCILARRCWDLLKCRYRKHYIDAEECGSMRVRAAYCISISADPLYLPHRYRIEPHRSASNGMYYAYAGRCGLMRAGAVSMRKVGGVCGSRSVTDRTRPHAPTVFRSNVVFSIPAF